MTVLFLSLFLVWTAAFIALLWGTWYTLRALETPSEEESKRSSVIPISVLKPLKGVESGMEDNLESFFRLTYPVYEILFSIADAKDPVIPLVSALLQKYPQVPARIIVGEENVGANPKINNMMRSYREAQFDWCLINDSNTRVDPQYLMRLSTQLKPDVGVVTATVAGQGAASWGGHFEATYLNTFFARWTHIAYALGQPFVIGKSMCFRRSTAERFGGIRSLGLYIAEDNMLGEAMKRLGMKVVVMKDPIPQHIGRHTFKAFWNRHVRWGRIRKSQAPLVYLAEPVVGALVSGIAGALAARALFSVPSPVFLAFHFVLWFACDLILIRRMGGRAGFSSLGAWLVRELVSLPMWLHAISGNTVSWRGSQMKLSRGGIVSHSA